MTEDIKSPETGEASTKWIVLQRLSPADIEDYLRLIQANREYLEPASIYVPYDIDDARSKLTHPMPEGRLDFCICANGELVGEIDIIAGRSRQAEIIYWIDHEHHGHGYAKEAVKAAADYAFNTLDMNTLRAWVSQDNIASQKTLQAAGFAHEDTNDATGTYGYTLYNSGDSH